ncbi:MAG: MFS transporter [Rhodospirillales bacterium]
MDKEGGSSAPAATRIPKGIWALGYVSLFMGISNSLVYSLFPIYMKEVLMISMSMVGIIEGIAQATMSVVRVFSGVFSDWLGRRKVMTVVGYSITMVTRLIIPLVATPLQVMGVRFMERFGIGVRSAARDALIADLVPRSIIGASFGLRHSLDRAGAVIGPLLAMLLMFLLSNNFQAVFWFAVIPAAVSVAILVIVVKDAPQTQAQARGPRTRLKLAEMTRLGAPLWWFVALSSILNLSFYSEAFLSLRAADVGLPFELIPLVLIAQNVAHSAIAYPAGKLSDRIGRTKILVGGFFVLIAAHLVLGIAPNPWVVMVGALLWGVFRGTSRSGMNAIVADLAPPHLRGTAFGVQQVTNAVSALLANVMAGFVWQYHGAHVTYYLGAGLAVIALLFFLLWVRVYGDALKKTT